MSPPGEAAVWTITASVPRLTESEVHLWRASVAKWSTHHSLLLELLDEAERRRAAQFVFAPDAEQFVVAHGLLRLLLGRYVAAPATHLSFTTTTTGKPQLLTPAGELAAIEFNISHAGDCVLIAMTETGAVGVDVEGWVDDVTIEEISTDFFSDGERRELAALAPAQRLAAFFALWTRKEAFVKATGAGMSAGLAHFDMTASADRSPQLLVDPRHHGTRWQVRDLDLGERYSGALVCDRHVTTVRTLTATPALLLSADLRS